MISLAAVLGMCVGSFLNVVAWRVPRGESVVHPPSSCPSCRRPLRPWENVPVAAWVALRGRCRTCRARIPARYPLVEAGCGALLALTWWRLGDVAVFGAMAVAFAGLVALALIDLDVRRIPNRVLALTFGATTAGLGLAAAAAGEWAPFARAGAGAAAAFAGLAAIHLALPRGMGAGDVKLAALCGLCLGWFGAGQVALGLFAACALGATAGLLPGLAGRARRRASVPFAPALAAGTILVALFGAPVIEWYLALLR